MAIAVRGNGILEMTEVGDEWPDKIKLTGGIYCITGDTSGVFELENADGEVVFRSDGVEANSTFTEDLVGWVTGLVVSSIPTNGKILLQHD